MNVKRMMGMIFAGRFDYVAYTIWVHAKGLDFRPVSLEQLGLSAERSVHHSASGGAYLSSVLRRIGVPRGSRALDLGSGKGGAACTLARFPFEEVLGVELTEELIQIAEANVKRLGLQNTHFVRLDAGQFTDLDRFTHLYMFNPFPANVVKEVMDNLRASLTRKPRPFTLIYYYPYCEETVMGSGLFKKPLTMTFPFSHPWHIYEHEFKAGAQ
jgi:SAM-dependent methyltransferase